MSVNPEDLPQDDDDKFGLSLPTGNMANQESGVRPEIQHSKEIDQAGRRSDEKYKPMGWKGIDDDQPDDDDDEEPQLSFSNKEPIPEDELDMTPMVDVTFLLLIFFMVTASFTLQKSLEQNHAKSEDPSPKPVDPDPNPPEDYVEILIDQSSTFYVTSRSEDEVECPSDSEMRSRVRDAVKSDGARRLVIIAHVDSLHRKVITAWDTALINDIQEIDFQTTEEDY